MSHTVESWERTSVAPPRGIGGQAFAPERPSGDEPVPGQKQESSPRAGRAAVSLLLLAVIVAAGFYGWRSLREADIQISQIPEMLKSVTNLDARLGAIETQSRKWADNLDSLTGRLGKLETKVNRDFRLGRKYAKELSEQLEARINTRLNEQNAKVDSRLRQVESEQASAGAEVARLNSEIEGLHKELAAVQQENRTELAAISERIGQSDRHLDEVANQVAQHRVNFELAKNRVYSPSQEISLKVTETDVRYQRYSGWIWFDPDRRTVWVRDQGVQEPVIFYSKAEGRPYEVVITGVTENSAAGYLLLPGPENPGSVEKSMSGDAGSDAASSGS